jgi:VWFA-related protein
MHAPDANPCRTSRRLAAAALAAFTAASVAAHGTSPPQQEVFRTGVDVVHLDVTVLDARQQPVRGLTADDFTILEDGKPQSIVTFVPVDVPPRVEPRAAWMHDEPDDIVSNAQDVRRLVVIVMDDALTGYEHGESRSARAIGHAVIDQLGPSDMAAVLFTFRGRTQNFTTDRSKLRSAVESYIARRGSDSGPPLPCDPKLRVGRSCVVETLETIASVLRAAPPGRKLVVLIGSAGGLEVNTDPFSPIAHVQAMFRAIQEANVTVNVFDPAGLQTYGPSASDRFPSGARGRIAARRRGVDELRALAENTGGRTFVDTNAPEAHVPAVFEQSGSYYLLGFQSTNENTDGRFRRVRVSVDRPGVTVQTRSGYFAPRRADARRPTTPPRSVDTALASGIPVRDLPLRMHVAVVPEPGARDVAVAVTAALEAPRADMPGGDSPFEVVVAAFDRDVRPRGRFQQTIRLPPSTNGSAGVYETHARLPLRPGRYEIRLAVEHGGRAGSLFANVDVPDPRRADVALSDLLLARGAPPAPGSVLADLLPVTPTAVRDFDVSDRVTAMLRIHQRGKGSRAPLNVATRILDETQRVVFQRTDEYAAEPLTGDRAIDHQLELPLARLPSGPYLLVVEADGGDASLRRTTRFTVR